MRYQYILGLALVSAAAMGGMTVVAEVTNGQSDGAMAKTADHFQLRAVLPNAPKQVSALRTDKKNLNQRLSGEIAKQILENNDLKITGSDNTRTVLSGSGETEITVYKGGPFNYSTGKELRGMYKQEELLSKEQAKDVATEFVRRFIDADLLNKDTVDISRSEVANDETCRYSLKDGKTECYATNQHVNVYLSYNGVKIDGAGGKLRVYLAKNGELVGLMNCVGKLVPVPGKKASVITPKEAIEKLRTQGYVSVTIEAIDLVYNVPPPEANAALVELAYKIRGAQHLPGGESVGFLVFIPAAK